MAEWVLGIETSCDETSAAVLRRNGNGPELAGLSILSQDVQRIFGGVVPELASRAHLQTIGSRVDRALAELDARIDRTTADLLASRAASDTLRLRLIEGRLTIARIRQLVRVLVRLGELRRDFL